MLSSIWFADHATGDADDDCDDEGEDHPTALVELEPKPTRVLALLLVPLLLLQLLP